MARQPVLDDLFAWSASYLRVLGLLSTLSRPLTPDQFDTLLNRATPRHPWKLAGGAIGLIIGEMLFHNNKLEIDAASAASPNSTLAFAIMRAWYLGFSGGAIPEICNKYINLFEYLQRADSVSGYQAVHEVAVSLVGIESDRIDGKIHSEEVRRWMNDLRSGAKLYDVARDVLGRSVDLLSRQDASRIEEMTAEDRVQFLDKVAPTLSENVSSGGRLERAFALALSAFVCRPGLEQQATLLREHATRLPEAWLWLGALQAFSPILESLSLNYGAGWRVARELFRPEEPWASPKADAAISEMEILSRGKSKLLERLTNRTRIEIEIYPMITIAVRGLKVVGSQPQSGARQNNEYFASRYADAFSRVEGIESGLRDLLRLLREIRGNEPDGGGGRSGRKRR